MAHNLDAEDEENGDLIGRDAILQEFKNNYYTSTQLRAIRRVSLTQLERLMSAAMESPDADVRQAATALKLTKDVIMMLEGKSKWE